MIRVFAYPFDWNPYQGLLYGAMRNKVRVFYAKNYPYIGICFFPLASLVLRLRGCRIAHIHWQALRLDFLPARWQKVPNYYFQHLCYMWLRLLGYRIVWTVHNVLPHEPVTSNDVAIARYLSRVSKATIVHSSYTLQQMEELDISTEHSHVIPHGNYADTYPVTISREEARAKMGLASDERVLMFFGNVRRYKGVPDLLRAYQALDAPRVHLVIAGASGDVALEAEIKRVAQECPSVTYHNQRIPSHEVAVYFQACDVVCLPFRSITTSGSALLALTFGKPIVAPCIGAIQDIPKEVGVLYDPTDEDALLKALAQILKNPRALAAMGEASKKYSATLSWKEIAAKTYKVYQDILRDRTPTS